MADPTSIFAELDAAYAAVATAETAKAAADANCAAAVTRLSDAQRAADAFMDGVRAADTVSGSFWGAPAAAITATA